MLIYKQVHIPVGIGAARFSGHLGDGGGGGIEGWECGIEGVYTPFPGACWDAHTTFLTEQTGVKTLPSRNFVCGR